MAFEEIEALSFIYENNEINTADDHVEIKLVLDSVDVTMVFKFPEDYPSSIPQIEIVSDKINQKSVEYLIDSLNNAAQELLGQQMVYSLVEHFKTEFANVQKQTSNGTFAVLSDELMIHLFDFFDLSQLVSLAGVCNKWKEYVNDNSLWYNRIKDNFPGEKIPSRDVNENYRRTFFDVQRKYIEKQMKQFRWIIPVYDRRGTEDEFPSNIPWTNEVERRLKLEPHLFDVNSTDKTISSNFNFGPLTSARLCEYTFIACDKVDKLFKNSRWYIATQKKVAECPYITKILGYVGLTNLVAGRLLSEICLGNICNVLDDKYLTTLTQANVHLDIKMHKSKYIHILVSEQQDQHSSDCKYQFLVKKDIHTSNCLYARNIRKIVNEKKGSIGKVLVREWMVRWQIISK